MTLPKIKLPETKLRPPLLEAQTDLERRSNFARPLIAGLIIIHLLGFMMMILGSFLPDPPTQDSFVLMGFGLLLYLGVFYLNREGNVQASAYLVSIGFNIEIYINFFTSAIDPNTELIHTNFVSYILSLAVILSGMLIHSKAPFYFALVNTVAAFFAYNAAGVNSRDIISYVANLGLFLLFIALISWLYQSALQRTDKRLREAQRQLLRTELMRRDLEIARQTQKELFPDPPAPQNGFQLTGFVQPARETSGDFYDFVPLGPHKLGVLIGDVTGKSLAAAMMMTSARSVLRNAARQNPAPADALFHANQTLIDDGSAEHMTTVFYGVLDTRARRLHYANAGHPFALHKRGDQVQELDLPGCPLGAFEGVQYEQKTLQFKAGDRLILYSDGISEAMNPQKALFGFERLQETFRQTNSSPPEAIKQSIWQAVEKFQQGVEQSDDMTLVIISVEEEESVEAAAPQIQKPLQAVGVEAI